MCATVKKAECLRIDAFELWCWRRFLRVPWTARLFRQVNTYSPFISQFSVPHSGKPSQPFTTTSAMSQVFLLSASILVCSQM